MQYVENKWMNFNKPSVFSCAENRQADKLSEFPPQMKKKSWFCNQIHNQLAQHFITDPGPPPLATWLLKIWVNYG